MIELRNFFAAIVMVVFAAATLAPAPVAANQAAVALVNQYRAAKGRQPMNYSKKLEQAAARHAQELERRGVLDHSGANGSSPGDRARRAGYRWCYVSENLAQGPWDLNGVIKAWSGSPSHAKNMFNRKAREFGVARSANGYWVMVLAKPGCR